MNSIDTLSIISTQTKHLPVNWTLGWEAEAVAGGGILCFAGNHQGPRRKLQLGKPELQQGEKAPERSGKSVGAPQRRGAF